MLSLGGRISCFLCMPLILSAFHRPLLLASINQVYLAILVVSGSTVRSNPIGFSCTVSAIHSHSLLTVRNRVVESHIDEVAAKYGIKNIARMPINPKLAAACDKGLIELYDGNWLDETTDMLEKL